MRLIEQNKSKDGETIYQFLVGGKEVRLLRDVLRDIYRGLPKGVLELQPMRSRLHNILKELDIQVRANHIKE